VLLAKGYVYRGLKPVNWCFDCGSALAEAEVEYEDRKDPAIDVGFAFAEPERVAKAFGLPKLPDKPGYAVIWTTTPWTLPGNQALNLHPEFTYHLVDAGKVLLILAAELQEKCLARYGLSGTTLGACKGLALENIRFRHPFYDRNAPMYVGEYVTLDTGTGIVHSAPAYGVEDFESCRRHGMKDDEILTPVLGDGKFAASLQLFGGQSIWKANAEIVKALAERGVLFANESYVHSYMHCWRHKTPVILRATTQWFAAMDKKIGKESLRRTALRGIEATEFFPAWGQARLHGMIANRPDWTLSRQRQWGVPMPLFLHRETGEPHPRTPDLIEQVAKRVEKGGIEAWQGVTAEELLGEDAAHYEKSRDTLDVWFDSGSTHRTVLRGSNPELGFPADLYLEGSDQHRGWFHSSLLVSCMTDGVPPYRALLTHGFVIDLEGRKMSKSKGNTMAPHEISGTLGAEILRLWVASGDFSGELTISSEILKRVVEAYRRIRNTLRFLLANTSDFDAAKQAVPVAQMTEIDRYALALMAREQQAMAADYARFQFHLVAQRLQSFCSEDLGAFYLDILKDRLYTARASSIERRSGQTVLHAILSAMVRLMAPVLSFTADEVWGYTKEGAGGKSVFLAEFPKPEETFIDDALEARWDRIIAVRGEVAKVLEALRRDKKIGHSLDAGVTLYAEPQLYEFLNGYRNDLAFIFIVSSVEIASESGAPNDAYVSDVVKGLRIAAGPAKGVKCGRCWMYQESVGTVKDHPDICGRCAGNL